MRLLLINHELPPVGGGAGNATWFVAVALRELGHDVRIVTGAYRDLPRHELRDGIQITRIRSVRRRLDRSNSLEMLSFLASALTNHRQVRAGDSDAIIAFFSVPAGIAALAYRRRWGTPYLVSLRGGDVPGLTPEIGWIHKLIAPLRRRVLRRAVAVIANAAGLAELAQRADGVPVNVIPNGVDTDYFQPANRKSGAPPKVLFVGRFHRQKNLTQLLHSFDTAAKQTPMQLDLVGDGPERHDLQALARGVGCDHLITWRGWLDKDALRRAYQEADIFVNPSFYEGMPNTVLEAMASGLPIVASRVGGNTELVEQSGGGLLFDIDQPNQLTQALASLASSREKRVELGQNARNHVCERYSWSQVARGYVDLITDGDR